ncbi:hypothetical protein U1Q18_007410, partial [Sarracenia purpurea var. burkii]
CFQKEMFVEVSKCEKSAPFAQVLKLLAAKGEYLAFALDTNETRMMIDIFSDSVKIPSDSEPVINGLET